MRSTTRICAVRIGVDHWLMPEADALRVFAAMRNARRIDRDYHNYRRWRLAADDTGDPAVEIVAVRPEDIDLPAPAPRQIEDRSRR